MNLALALSLITATFNLTSAVAQFAISRAPGWRVARTFAVISLTAGLYSVGNLVFCSPGLPDWAYQTAARWNYVMASVHVIAWLPFAFGGPDAQVALMPRPVRLFAGGCLALAALFAVTGLHLRPEVAVIPVAWAHVTYRYAVTTPVGDVYGLMMLLILFVSFGQLLRRMVKGESDLDLVVAGMAVFVLTASIEVMVAQRMLVFVSPVDLGFLAVVAPTSVRMLQRFIRDANRLEELSQRLAGEVRDRTEERDRAEAALVESQRHAALGRLAAGVGHEINNPLTYLQLALDHVGEHLSKQTAPAEVRGAIDDARDGARRIQKVVEGLRTYSRRQEERRALDPREAVRAALKVAGSRLRHVARLDADLAEVPMVLADEPRLVQAVVNLLANAAQALDEQGGAGHIQVRTAMSREGWALIEVRDDGPGIPEEHRRHLAEPYFTTRGESGGLGLGLFVSRGIVDAHGGRLEIESEPGRGTCARIALPPGGVAVAEKVRESRGDDVGRGETLLFEAPSTEPAPPPRMRPQLLLVDDEPLVLHMLARALERDWEVTTTADGATALSLTRQRPFDVVVCDLHMPGLSGMDLAEAIEVRDAALRRRMLFITGGAVTHEARAFVARPDVTHLAKPIDLAELRRQLAARMDAGR